ncbi:hypothetical protein OWR29_45505 [Actinoplanes sp. Pm04-4]|uniref:Uncharacterized protein n=1 Tax=Paractinoplanes pyxinae TaxID=2997416 RepID=A0ABT4BI90_9ACTN|nr:hypothetical protein [Actinoplanes pyxinae]MCY1145303.1 hypothetical protein [Actinoplanes pyxinae]
MLNDEFRVGDVLRISCPFTDAQVTGVSSSDVSIRWPWWRRDPDTEWIEWNGDVAVARGPGTYGWADELFRTEPSAELLRAGMPCRVGIPPTVVHVIEVQSFDPPLETGRLPRPHREIVVLPRGVPVDPDAIEQGNGINPDDDIPMAFDLVFRPYSFLRLGDDVVDRDGRAWRFDGPWDWHAYDERSGIPAWPLQLMADGGGLVPATATGSHQSEIARWRSAAL